MFVWTCRRSVFVLHRLRYLPRMIYGIAAWTCWLLLLIRAAVGPQDATTSSIAVDNSDSRYAGEPVVIVAAVLWIVGVAVAVGLWVRGERRSFPTLPLFRDSDRLAQNKAGTVMPVKEVGGAEGDGPSDGVAAAAAAGPAGEDSGYESAHGLDEASEGSRSVQALLHRKAESSTTNLRGQLREGDHSVFIRDPTRSDHRTARRHGSEVSPAVGIVADMPEDTSNPFGGQSVEHGDAAEAMETLMRELGVDDASSSFSEAERRSPSARIAPTVTAKQGSPARGTQALIDALAFHGTDSESHSRSFSSRHTAQQADGASNAAGSSYESDEDDLVGALIREARDMAQADSADSEDERDMTDANLAMETMSSGLASPVVAATTTTAHGTVPQTRVKTTTSTTRQVVDEQGQVVQQSRSERVAYGDTPMKAGSGSSAMVSAVAQEASPFPSHVRQASTGSGPLPALSAGRRGSVSAAIRAGPPTADMQPTPFKFAAAILSDSDSDEEVMQSPARHTRRSSAAASRGARESLPALPALSPAPVVGAALDFGMLALSSGEESD